MKKSTYVGLFLAATGISFIGCEKEDISNLHSSNPQSQMHYKETNAAGAGQLEEKKRSYTWVNDKLDCSQDGSGCIVSSVYHTENGEVNLAVIQVLELIEIGDVNLNQYFVNNDLSYEFPSLYEDDVKAKITSGALLLSFEFPYFKLTTNQGVLDRVFNYESTLSDNNVLAALQAGGSYTKKVSLNTDPNVPAVWKCTEDGDNCKVSSVKFNASWLADNPQYMFAPTTETILSAEIDNDGTNKRVVVKTTSGDRYGIQF